MNALPQGSQGQQGLREGRERVASVNARLLSGKFTLLHTDDLVARDSSLLEPLEFSWFVLVERLAWFLRGLKLEYDSLESLTQRMRPDMGGFT